MVEHLIAADRPIAELELRFTQLGWDESGGEKRIVAQVQACFGADVTGGLGLKSAPFAFRAPLGPIEASELRWYLNDFYIWPVGLVRQRAERIEALLPKWGRALFGATLGELEASNMLAIWEHQLSERRVSVYVNPSPPNGLDPGEQALYMRAASGIFALPWELLHDGERFLFCGTQPVRVRRCLSDTVTGPSKALPMPIRVLLISPRPDDKVAGYIDHRASALPLVQAVQGLGALVELTLLSPPTLAALKLELKRAREQGREYHVVHFDGHGTYNRKKGLGDLCFEKAGQERVWQRRESDLVSADLLAEALADYDVPLVFLEACQTAQSERGVTGSVAARLLVHGVRSVIAMSHSVLVVAALRFVSAFYTALATGERIGTAMVCGQKVLYDDQYRFEVEGAGAFHLQDWFVPVLYQAYTDPRLFAGPTSEAFAAMLGQRETPRLGTLPAAPSHGFQGRSSVLLMLERILQEDGHACVVGQGGAGKTTVACELARWLVASKRFDVVAFVSLEQYSDDRAVLDALGQQLVPGIYSVAEYGQDLEAALQPVLRALKGHATLLVFDNFESVLPAPGRLDPAAEAATARLLDLAHRLQACHDATRLLFTSRECLPAPFATGRVELAPLSSRDAIQLVANVLATAGQQPNPRDPGSSEEIAEFVDALGCHARSLVLLAPHLSSSGVGATLADLKRTLAAMPPNDRENSLYASIELSLARLPSEIRQCLAPLALVHGGCHLHVLGELLQQGRDQAKKIKTALIKVGLARDGGFDYLHIDPILPLFLSRELKLEARTQARVRWKTAIIRLIHSLYEQRFQNVDIAVRLTLYELVSFLTLMEDLSATAPLQQIIEVGYRLETLIAKLARPRALERVMVLREVAASRLLGWSNAAFNAASRKIDCLLESDDLVAALAAAQVLVFRCQAGGPSYQEASYNSALALRQLGEVLKQNGRITHALTWLERARVLFNEMATLGGSAEHMADNCLANTGDCLAALGRWEEASEIYTHLIERAHQKGRKRDAAVLMGQLATTHMYQGNFGAAIAAHEQARHFFEKLDEHTSVATAWHQLGRAHQELGACELAERAFRQALAINVKLKNRSGEASNLGQLGSLFDSLGRLEEAIVFHQQAADIRREQGYLAGEGRSRSNLASIFIRLSRYDQARIELNRAIFCKEPGGPAARLWKTWDLLCDLEQATQQPLAAQQAREKAREAFLTYRRQGGENDSYTAQLSRLVGQAVGKEDDGETLQVLIRYEQDPETPATFKVMAAKLRAVLGGERDFALVDDSELDFANAVELQLLLESLESKV